MGVGGQPGNTNGTALKDPGERQKAYASFCKHIEDGYPIPAWSYRNGDNKCCWATMVSYIEKNPIEFESFLKQEAHANSYKKWFDRGVNLTDGKVKGNPSPQTWATIMRNMFHWDREKDEKEKTDTSKIDAIVKMFNQIPSKPTESPQRADSNRTGSPDASSHGQEAGPNP